jgi:hypothetical protein
VTTCTFGVYLPQGGGLVTLEIYDEDGVIVCGIYQIEGRLNLPPKQWLRTMRAELAKIETIARNAGCAEMRLAGRNWQRILPDYEPLPGIENRLRKALT